MNLNERKQLIQTIKMLKDLESQHLYYTDYIKAKLNQTIIRIVNK